MRMGMRLEGLQKVENELNRRLARVRNVSAQALVDVGLDLWRKSNQRAPVKTGDLRASAYLSVNGQQRASGDKPSWAVEAGGSMGATVVEFGYGVPYALWVHELPEYKRPTTPGTQPKFLETALTENADRYARYVKQRAREAAEKP